MNERPAARAGLRNLAVRYRQWLIVGGIGTVAILGLLALGREGDDTATSGSLKLNDPVNFSRVDRVDAEVIWIEAAEERLRTIEERLQTTLRENAAIQDRNETMQSEITQVIDDARKTIRQQAGIIAEFEAGTLTAPAQPGADPFAALPPAEPNSLDGDPFAAVPPAGATTPRAAPPGVQPSPLDAAPGVIRFELTPLGADAGDGVPMDDRPTVLDTKHYLPAGSYAPGVITAGAAAQVSVTGQADPKPVLIRITGRAVSAATESTRRLDIDISGCVITGEARGEISSERVYVRLQRMTCERDDGVIETNVKGYVSASGQAGVRGDVISREGDLLDRSFTAGILSGFGNSVSQGLSPNVLNNSSGNRLSDADLLDNAGKAGLGKGIGNAGEKLSEYYIRRAEQYQPVVMLKGGTRVQVVFLEGVRIDGKAS